MKYLSTILLITAFSICARAQVYPGMQAPEFKVGPWVKGTPVDHFEKGQVYVVEFWATWCGPCRGVIPELTKLAEKYMGQATVIGVSIGEGNTDRVKPFVAQMGEQMNYHVAIDAQESPTARTGFMAQHWVEAAGLTGIPAAFIIGKTGQIEYLGGSVGLDEIVGKILAGTWDTKAYAASIPELRAGAERYALEKSLLSDVTAGNKSQYYQVLDASFSRWAEQKNWGAINDFLWNHLAEVGSKQELPAGMRDYEFAVKWMNRLVSANPAEPALLDTKAWLYFRSGDKARAVETEQKAIGLLPAGDPNKAAFEKALQTFKQ